MKIVDLINKKANGEEVPKKIKYLESIWEWSSLYFDYRSDEQNSTIEDELLFRGIFKYPKDRLNDEVEIIEEELTVDQAAKNLIKFSKAVAEHAKELKPLKIERNEMVDNAYFIRNEHGTPCGLTKHSKMIAEKVNELIGIIIELGKEE